MFSTLTSASRFNLNRRLERPPRQNQDSSVIKTSRSHASVVINNLNIALSGLSPNHTVKSWSPSSLRSPPPSPFSFTSSKSSRFAESVSSMSSGSSIRSYQLSRSELPARHPTAYDTETTPKASSFTHAKPRSASKTSFPFGFALQGSLPAHSAIHRDTYSYTPRPSIDSTSSSSSSSSHSWRDVKERKVPPPLHLNDSNLHPRNFQEPPVIEVIAPGPPRVQSRLSSYTVDLESPTSPPPVSPDFQMPSEEEVRRRRHEKVMRTLGEMIPAELVYRGPKIPNVTVFPDPPSDSENDITRRETTRKKLVKRASFTLSSFPNLSSVTSALLPTSHGRSKSRDLLDVSDPSPSVTPTPSTFPRHYAPAGVPTRNANRSHTHPRPQSIYSPIVFRTPLEATAPSRPRPISVRESDDNDSGHLSPQQREAQRVAKLARRASLSTATFLPTSPLRDGFRDLDLPSPRQYNPETIISDPTVFYVDARRPRPESMIVMSPVVFAKHVLPQSEQFTLIVDDEEEPSQDADDDDDDTHTAGSHTPPQRKVYAKSVVDYTLGARSEHQSRSNPHLPLYPRPDTPFQSVHEADSGYLAPPGTWKTMKGQELLQRKERRQGWSGDWNQGDMQEVIKKLRNLK